MDQKCVKTEFLNLLTNLVINFYWICSIMKIYIIYCVPAKISFFGKFFLLRCRAWFSEPIRLQDFLTNHISRTNQWDSLIFLHVDANSNKLKVDQKMFGFGQSGHRTLKLTVSQEWIDGISWFFYLVHETLKSDVF